jgi:small nuclear ribonucleoprotein (snRNP)-like protein
MEREDCALRDLIDQTVVVDTKGTMVFIGRLVRVAGDCVVLEDADTHDCEQGYSGKELYVINACNFGVRPNRQKVYVPRQSIVAISALDDIIVD